MKRVFATYVMQLVERGEFQLDVAVAKQLLRPLDAQSCQRWPQGAVVELDGSGVLVFADALKAIVR